MNRLATLLLRIWVGLIAVYLPIFYFALIKLDHGIIRDIFRFYIIFAPFFIGIAGYIALLFYWGTRLRGWGRNILGFIGCLFIATFVFFITIIGVAPFSP